MIIRQNSVENLPKIQTSSKIYLWLRPCYYTCATQIEHMNVCYERILYIHCVRMTSSTQQKVSQLVQNCKYLPEILNSTTVTIFTRDFKAVFKPPPPITHCHTSRDP